MKLENNPQMVAMLDHAKGSLENKIRQAYNSGYNDGFKAGVFEAWDDMRKQLDKSLRQTVEQTEPQNDVSCFTCIHDNTGHIECQSCDDNYSNFEPKDEPQTDCAWQNDEHIPTELASTMLKNRFKEQK